MLEPGENKKRNIVTEGNITKALLIIALPIIISNILQSILEVVDMYFIGKLGDAAIAGGTMSMSIIMVLTTVIFGIVTATAAFISRAYGSDKPGRIQVILVHSLYLVLGFAAIIAVIGMFWSEDLLRLLGADPDAVIEGAKFLQPLLVGLFVMVVLMVFVTAFQSSGDSRTPMYVMIAINIVNIALNPTLIHGMFGMPAFGIAGSAYASLLSRTAGILLLLGIIYLHPKFRDCPVRLPTKFSFEPALIKDIVGIAIPSAIQSGVRSLAFLFMTAIVALYGLEATAAYGVSVRLDMLGLIIVMGFCTAIAVMVGQNLGAQKVERAEAAVKYAIVINAIFMACVAVFYILNAEGLLSFFGLEAISLADGLEFMHTIPPSYFLIAIAMTLGFAMNGAGLTKPGMYSAVIGQLIVQVGLSAALALTGHSLQFIWYAVVCGTVVMCLCDFYFYRKGDWKRKELDLGGDE